MPACIYNTDSDWIESLRRDGIRDNVNFWRKDTRKFHLPSGSLFYFKVRGSNQIAGRSVYREQLDLEASVAWGYFGRGNGVGSEAELRLRASEILALDDGASLNCLILDKIEFLEEADYPEIPDGLFPGNILGGKFFDESELSVFEGLFEPKKSRNPDWTRDEHILALELYLRVNPLHTSEKNIEIVELSELLNTLPIHARERVEGTFRNPNGVYMKLCNFLRCDPSYEGTGLSRGSKLEQAVWDEFNGDSERLRRVAKAIRKGALLIAPPSSFEEEAAEKEEEFDEGAVLTKLHKLRERNPQAAKRKKRKVLEEMGRLACEVCDFDFAQFYGELGEGFAECHHRLPLSDLPGQKTTRLADLAIVCANCHRMLHRRRPWCTVEELSKLLSSSH